MDASFPHIFGCGSITSGALNSENWSAPRCFSVPQGDGGLPSEACSAF